MSHKLPYNPETLPRELKKFYISMDEVEQKEVLKILGKKKLDELFSHIPTSLKFEKAPDIGASLPYYELKEHLEKIADKYSPKTSFIGDALPHYEAPSICQDICGLRGLTTAYTPYQPERCQGTLQTLWIYASALSELTGFEAINASLYDRATCLYEGLQTCLRLRPNKNTVFISQSLYPQDLEVLSTLAQETSLKLISVPCNKNGTINIEVLKNLAEQHQADLAGFAFPQVNSLGLLEDVHTLTDFCHDHNIISVAVIDPMQLSSLGLLKPSEWGKNKKGPHIIVGEGQHLGLPPLFGGPGLGIYGIRFNDEDKISIRSTAGRYVGKGIDNKGQEALALVLSTREQHIRREKATSNICSNQSFVATLAGAGILARGEKGMNASALKAQTDSRKVLQKLLAIPGVQLAFSGAFYSEFILEIPGDCQDLISLGVKANLHLGVDVSQRVKDLTGKKGHYLLISLFDRHHEKDLEQLVSFFENQWGKGSANALALPESTHIPSHLKQQKAVGLPNYNSADLFNFYQKLADLNVSPDDHIYPLGSCTMKYNPYINDYAASLPGFAHLHPQAPESEAQGPLQILFETQELFKKITGLKGVTTQPVAGAQGELVGLKLFQAYHRERGEITTRDIILIPKSAHGTNPATATMAGIETLTGANPKGIVVVSADETGQVNLVELKELVLKYQKRILGLMVTNPNTSGIFESNFKEMADLIHSVGGLVYMDGANMNAIASWVNLEAMGVDAVHNNLHKTWTIPHGGGGPGDAIVAVSQKLVDYLPGIQVKKENGFYKTFRASKCIGSFHRHFGNFAHKVRAYTYLKALGSEGVRQMSGVAVLSANYLYHTLKKDFVILPTGTDNIPRMHEFIISLSKEIFEKAEKSGTQKTAIIPKMGKLFLDFGLHAPTVAFPEVFGLMIEPTESYSKKEMDQFIEVVQSILDLVKNKPELLQSAPHFTPVFKIDEVDANKNLTLKGAINKLPTLPQNIKDPRALCKMAPQEVKKMIIAAAQSAKAL